MCQWQSQHHNCRCDVSPIALMLALAALVARMLTLAAQQQAPLVGRDCW
jgi:hypothetical protein